MKTFGLLAGTLLASGLLLGGGAPATAQDSITFTSFGGAFQEAQRKALLNPAAEQLGITILEDTLTGIAEVRAQVLAGAVTWDIVDLGLADCAAAQAEGILEPLDYDKISLEGFEPAAYSDAWAGIIYFSTVIGYNTETMGDNPPNSWADFWDVENFPGARALRNNPAGMLELALLADGVAPADLYPLDVERAMAKYEGIRDHLLFWASGAESQSLLRDGECVMGFLWSTRANMLKEETQGRIDYTFENGLLQPGLWVVPKGNPAGKEAFHAIASMQSAPEQIYLLERMGNGPANPEGAALVPEAMKAANPTDPANTAVQAKIDAQWYFDNHTRVYQEFLDRIAS